MIRDKDFKNKVAISPSRLETFLNCTQIYAAKYIHKIPDKGNMGSARGSSCHEVLELLIKDKHKDKVSKIQKEKTCRAVPSVWKLTLAYCKHFNVTEEEDQNLVDKFICTALNNEFYGPKGTIERHAEKEFDFEVDDKTRGVSYRLKGIIDASFEVLENDSISIYIRDYKGSKQKFSGEKINSNTQAICYQLAVLRYLFPEYNFKRFEFLFLKFDKNPILLAPLKDKDFLSGYEIYLTEMQKQLNEFTEENANDNLAALNPANKWLCGKEGLKKDGTPNFICSCRKPLVYKVAIKDGKIVKSCFMEEELKLGEGEELDYRYYTGCSMYFDKDGNKRQLSFND